MNSGVQEWHPLHYSSYKLRKGPESVNNKWKISVIICDTNVV